ncbi:MAG: hypothetical protein ACFFAU_08085 [Candidatus Hodarchaeota archaeon]
MSVDITYIKSAIETLDLIQQLFAHLREQQTTDKLNDFLAQIESKAVARISSSLGQKLGIDIPVADQEGKSSQYWKGVRDMAKLAKKQFLAVNNEQKFIQFLSNTQNTLSARISPEKQDISPLEELLSEEQPASPLEEMLTEPSPTPISSTPEPKTQPTPTPTPVIPTPEPEPEPQPTPTPTPVIPTPEPKPEPQPIPTPTPVIPTPEPEPEPQPIPTPTPVIPTPEPKPEPQPKVPEILETPKKPSRQPIAPITPTSEPLPDKFQALGEALQASGLDQTPEVPTEAVPSLKDMLLDKDEEGEKEEDDMLSLSLREALKILRDEDED